MKLEATCTSMRGYLQAISGVFISPENPGGFTPKELDVLAALVFVMKQKNESVISTHTRQSVAAMMNHPVQVITNYINVLKAKKAIDKDNKLSMLILSSRLVISNATPL